MNTVNKSKSFDNTCCIIIFIIIYILIEILLSMWKCMCVCYSLEKWRKVISSKVVKIKGQTRILPKFQNLKSKLVLHSHKDIKFHLNFNFKWYFSLKLLLKFSLFSAFVMKIGEKSKTFLVAKYFDRLSVSKSVTIVVGFG